VVRHQVSPFFRVVVVVVVVVALKRDMTDARNDQLFRERK